MNLPLRSSVSAAASIVAAPVKKSRAPAHALFMSANMIMIANTKEF
jgi:hypothetical protein